MSRKSLNEIVYRWHIVDSSGSQDNMINNTSLVNYRKLSLQAREKVYSLSCPKGQWMIKRFNLQCVIGAWSGARWPDCDLIGLRRCYASMIANAIGHSAGHTDFVRDNHGNWLQIRCMRASVNNALPKASKRKLSHDQIMWNACMSEFLL